MLKPNPVSAFPIEWENQDKWNGGWTRKANGKIEPRIGGKMKVLAKMFNNPDMPQIEDYYEPFDFDYQHLHTAPLSKHQPTARPRSLISGERMEKIESGPNWEEILGPSSPSALATRTSTRSRRRSTASMKIPS